MYLRAPLRPLGRQVVTERLRAPVLRDEYDLDRWKRVRVLIRRAGNFEGSASKMAGTTGSDVKGLPCLVEEFASKSPPLGDSLCGLSWRNNLGNKKDELR